MITKGLKKVGYKLSNRENVTEFVTISGKVGIHYHIDEARFDANEPALYMNFEDLPENLRADFAEQVYDWMNDKGGEFKDFKRITNKG